MPIAFALKREPPVAPAAAWVDAAVYRQSRFGGPVDAAEQQAAMARLTRPSPAAPPVPPRRRSRALGRGGGVAAGSPRTMRLRARGERRPASAAPIAAGAAAGTSDGGAAAAAAALPRTPQRPRPHTAGAARPFASERARPATAGSARTAEDDLALRGGGGGGGGGGSVTPGSGGWHRLVSSPVSALPPSTSGAGAPSPLGTVASGKTWRSGDGRGDTPGPGGDNAWGGGGMSFGGDEEGDESDGSAV